MKYISTKDASCRWGICERRVRVMCANGSIHGSVLKGNRWLIPENAKKPPDGRTKEGKGYKEEPYKFPILAYSEYFCRQGEFSEQERVLFDLEIQYLKGQYAECYFGVKMLLAQDCPEYIKVGAYHVGSFAALLMGLADEYLRFHQLLHDATEKETIHTADYRLVYSDTCILQKNIDSNLLSQQSDIHKLTSESLPVAFFRKAVCRVAGFSAGIAESYDEMEIACEIYDREQLDPIAMYLHFCLGIFAQNNGKREASEYHFRRAVEIGIRQEYLGIFARFYYLAGETPRSILKKANEKLYEKVVSLGKSNCAAIQFVASVSKEQTLFDYLSENDFLFISLINCRKSNEEISEMMEISVDKVKATLKTLYCKLHVSGRGELKKRVEEYFKPLIAAHFSN